MRSPNSLPGLSKGHLVAEWLLVPAHWLVPMQAVGGGPDADLLWGVGPRDL